MAESPVPPDSGPPFEIESAGFIPDTSYEGEVAKSVFDTLPDCPQDGCRPIFMATSEQVAGRTVTYRCGYSTPWTVLVND